MSLFGGLLKSKARKQAETDIADAYSKVQSVDAGINVSAAKDLLKEAESAFKSKDWVRASSPANKCVGRVNAIFTVPRTPSSQNHHQRQTLSSYQTFP